MKMTSPHRIQVEFRPRISNNNLLNPLCLAAEAAILNSVQSAQPQLRQVLRLLVERALWDWQEHHHEEHVRRLGATNFIAHVKVAGIVLHTNHT